LWITGTAFDRREEDLPTVYDVPADELIKATADYLKKNVSEIAPPTWTTYAKTSSHRENPPQDPDWWYFFNDTATTEIYTKGPVGIARLRKAYGGRLARGNVGAHKRRGGGSAVMDPLQQLQQADLVKTRDLKGRVLTGKGISLLDSLAAEILRRLEKERPELRKYK
jgi:small subunit ribosomal protein S19e